MTRYGNEKEKMRSLLDPGPVPEIVEMRLREAYAALPERRPARPAYGAGGRGAVRGVARYRAGCNGGAAAHD